MQSLTRKQHSTQVDAMIRHSLPAATVGCAPSMQCTRLLQRTHLARMSSCGHLPAGRHHLPAQTEYVKPEKAIIITNQCMIDTLCSQRGGNQKKTK